MQALACIKKSVMRRQLIMPAAARVPHVRVRGLDLVNQPVFFRIAHARGRGKKRVGRASANPTPHRCISCSALE